MRERRARKRATRNLQSVEHGPPPGLLAFDRDVPVGSCQLTPRDALAYLENFRRLRRIDNVPVWSISCFYVRKDYRRQGVTSALIQAEIHPGSPNMRRDLAVDSAARSDLELS